MKIIKVFLFLFVIFLIYPPCSGQTSFSFSLATAARTSAGVYKTDGTLVKTLWNGINYNAGTFTKTWDGTNDEGVKVANGTYNIKVLSNNVKYEWEGTIGNNSTAATGVTKHRAFQGMYGMSFSGSNAYYCTNYNEGWTSSLKFNTANPFACTRILETYETSHCTSALASDDNFVYWGGVDAFDPENSFVFATNVSDDKEVTNFTSGIPIKTHFGKKFVSAIDNVVGPSSEVSAMAVQKNGDYLFIARKKANTIRVVNKTTGVLIRTLNFTSPRGLAIDGDNNLWVIHGANLAQKFAIQTDGTLSASTITLDVIDPMAIAVSPDNSTVAVCDGGISEQVKAFSVSTGDSKWVLGEAGGYTSDPNVNDYKFFFVDRNKGIDNTFTTFIAFAPDGSFWVGDGGNYRAQHYSSSRTFIDRVMYLPHSYSVAADRNDPTKVFNEYMEFKIDYSKPLAPNNGSWTLVRNYRATLPQNYYKDFIRDIFRSVITLSNGRTYAMLTKTTGDYKTTLVELPVNAPMRFTGIEFGAFENPLIETKGDLKRYSNGGIGRSAVFSNCKFKGFDSSNNPIWDAPIVLSTIYPVQGTDPINFGNAQMGQTTASGLLVTFDKEGFQLGRGIGYHLGAIKPGENKFTWKTCKSTSIDYKGDFPKDGRFDIGNSVRAPGCAGGVYVVDDNILWNYHGEFWKGSQTNFWNHFSDEGLMIGQFGTWKTNFTASAPAELAGNTFSSEVVKGPDGNLYVYHNDESIHAGVHRWKVTGLNTISEQNISVALNVIGLITPTAPLLSANDDNNTLAASHALGSSEILVSENNGTYIPYAGTINVGNVAKAPGYWKFKIMAATGRNESSVVNSPLFTIVKTTPEPPTLIIDKSTNSISATHILGASEIIVSENNGPYNAYSKKISVGNSFREEGHWKFKVKAAEERNESAIAFSPVFIEISGPLSPILTANDKDNTLSASHSLGASEILVSENDGPFKEYQGQINVGNVERLEGYWKFKTRENNGRPESLVTESPIFNISDMKPPLVSSAIATSPTTIQLVFNESVNSSIEGWAFTINGYDLPISTVSGEGNIWTFTVARIKPGDNLLYSYSGSKGITSDLNENELLNITQAYITNNIGNPTQVPTLIANDELNTLEASHTLGNSEIIVSENNGDFKQYIGRISVGDVNRPAGYWKFKVKAAFDRTESAIVVSPAFTLQNGEQQPPIITADDETNTLFASHPLGLTEILVSENGGEYEQYTGTIEVGNVNRPEGYWKFKIRAVDGRNESETSSSPVFTESSLFTIKPKIIFSPNNDGIDDFWIIENIELHPDYEVVLYNVNGREIYKAKPYLNNYDGTYKGMPLHTEAFVYVIKSDNNTVKSGFTKIAR